MRNAIFPSFSSPFYSLGNSEVQMPSSNASSMELERLSCIVCHQKWLIAGRNSYSRGFFHDSQVSNDLQLGRFSPLSTVEVSQPLDYLSGADALMINSMYESASAPKFLSRFPSLEDCMENGRKRTFASDAMANETTKESKRRKSAEDQVPARRSNKLGERVTALQQLVSPFGKTDTASVLQEAIAHIKLLQEQIQVLSTPYFRVRPSLQSQNGGEEKSDLKSRGLCLVPVSSTLNLTKGEGSINRYSTGRTITTRF